MTTTDTLTAVSAAAYGEDVDALDAWDDLSIAVEADGINEILLDAYPADADPDDYPLGRPGIGLRLTIEQARQLAAALNAAAGKAEETK